MLLLKCLALWVINTSAGMKVEIVDLSVRDIIVEERNAFIAKSVF